MSDGFETRPVPRDFIERTRVVPLVHATGIQTDLVLGGPGVLRELELALDRSDLLAALEAAEADAG